MANIQRDVNLTLTSSHARFLCEVQGEFEVEKRPVSFVVGIFALPVLPGNPKALIVPRIDSLHSFPPRY